jgi:CubicO group peptidase (beta-lactamase class C family)
VRPAPCSGSFGDTPGIVVSSGLADRETGRSLGPDDRWFLGSVTKTYTAAMVLRAADSGVLSLDDALAKFLRGFPDGDRITVRHLLAQTSGLGTSTRICTFVAIETR